MSEIRVILSLLLMLPTMWPALPSIAAEGPAIELPGSGPVRFYNVRLKREANHWVVKGRLTRRDKEQKVSPGEVVAVIAGREGRAYRTSFYPRFIHRKTKRASRFTLRIPQKRLTEGDTLRLYYELKAQ